MGDYYVTAVSFYCLRRTLVDLAAISHMTVGSAKDFIGRSNCRVAGDQVGDEWFLFHQELVMLLLLADAIGRSAS